MKTKFIIIILLMLCSIGVQPVCGATGSVAEEETAAKQEITYYIEAVAQHNGVGKSVTVNVDLGRVLPSRLALKDNEVRQLTQSLSFNSAVDALNYLSFRGWILADTYTVTRANNTAVHYVMKYTSSEPSAVIKSLMGNERH